MEQDTVTLWVCLDCRDSEASGEEQLDDNDEPIETWTKVDNDLSIQHVTPGLIAEEHLDNCPNFEGGDYVGHDDEPCEDQEFSWTPCDGCGSHLGGSRHAYTAWLITKD